MTGPEEDLVTCSRLDPVHVVDVFVYVVVLNLAIQRVPAVISETFTLSLLTALLLKLVLEGVTWLKKRTLAHLRAARTTARQTVSALSLLLLLPGSKLVVLYLVDVLFGDRVSLGGFWAVTALIVVLMLCRAGVRRLLA
jgi:hypothetical protein